MVVITDLASGRVEYTSGPAAPAPRAPEPTPAPEALPRLAEVAAEPGLNPRRTPPSCCRPR